MGLDIAAYSHLNHIGRHEKDPTQNEGEPGGLDDWCHYDDHVQAYAYDTFPASFRGIPVLGTKTTHGAKLITGGCYEITTATKRHKFAAGSYGGYNAWRADLQQQFNPDLDPDGPFYELIWFADNEGCIGPEAARDLLADFERHAADYRSPEGWGEDGRYTNWTRAFSLAANGGLVRFH
ncbi:hypothetical protein ABZ671_01330 [Micromonospora sp. NPDC006766]|uniref:hypothetical protein n=1 Tax=Micromonospora sp. NPDC006766 TaxID=3154778 RepID=UPI0033D60DCF